MTFSKRFFTISKVSFTIVSNLAGDGEMMKNNPPSEFRGEAIVGIFGAVWILFYYLSTSLLDRISNGGWAIAIALFPVLPFLIWISVVMRQIRRLDELKQRVYLEATAIAFLLTLLLLMILGLLQRVISLPMDSWSYGDVWLFPAFFFVVGIAIRWRRYQ